MLEGLEISEVKLSELQNFGDLSSSFYLKEHLLKESFVKSKDYLTLGKNSYITDGEHGSPSWDELSEIKYITAENIMPNYILDTDFKTISKEQDLRNTRSRLKEDDVLVYTVGAYAGYVCKAEKHLFPANIPRSVAIIRVDKKKILPEYLSVFLNSKFGVFQTNRYRAGNSQPMLALEKIHQFVIANLSYNFQNYISIIYNRAYNTRIYSKSLYTQAEEFLLDELGLKDWQPSQEQNNIKLFSESFLTTGRLDAEYYQPKYDDYLNLANNYREGAKSLEWACQLRDINYIPKDNLEYKYIELANIGKSGQITDASINNGSELPSRARRLIEKGDVLISSIEGSLSSCALVTEEYDGALCSTGFYIIKSSEINSETLLVLFKSELMQNLLKQGCSGTILTAINKNEFLKLPIPLIDKNIQNQVSDLITDSFSLMKKSEYLLEIAKQAVETAIEENEEIAMEYIQKNTMI